MMTMQRFAKRFPHCFASLWFAVAWLMVSALFWLPFFLKKGGVAIISAFSLLYGVVPTIAVVIAGALLGAPILHSAHMMNTRRAIERSVGVGLLAVAIFFPLFALGYMATFEICIADVFGAVAINLVVNRNILVIGMTLITLIAGAAGWLLYKLALHVDRTSDI